MQIKRDFILDPSLVLYLPLWKLDGASFMSKDAYGHLCTVTGALWRLNGRYFDGSDDYIDLPDVASLKPDAWTFEWFGTCVDTGLPQCLIAWGNTRPVASLRYYADGRNMIAMGSANYTRFSEYSTISDGNFHHIAMVMPGALKASIESAVVYLDGESLTLSLGDSSGDQVSKSAPRIGATRDDNYDYKGIAGEVRLYNRALTPLEIQHNYLATKWRYR